ncbi:MAG TPA: hypothetical protein VGT06_11785 [Candidatus Methylomirabilis sp.]|jgi:hypothetical protein|nr:hypothetical protein [Candidatus Methylomirabilis sp.]
MPQSIAPGHPLRRLLTGLTERTFFEGLAWPDPEVTGYLAELLTDFAHVDNVYRIRNAAGQRVEEVAELLAEGDLLHRASTVEREREVHKHIGDYTLFMTGLFPEFLARQAKAGPAISRDAFLDHVRTGKHSYWVVSEFILGSHGAAAPLFRKLSENFELCVYGLGHVRAELDRLRDPAVRRVWGSLLE